MDRDGGPHGLVAIAIVLWWATIESGPVIEGTRGSTTTVLLVGALGASGQFLMTALPLRYGTGLGERTAESDGRVVARPLFLVVLGAVFVLTVFLDPFLTLALAALFGLGFLLQGSGPRVG